MLGGLIVSILVIPSLTKQADAIIASPPQQISKDIEDIGTEVARSMLRFQAQEVKRSLLQAWGIIQIGLAAAIFAAVTFTSHRSRFLVIVSLVLTLIVAVETFGILPTLRYTGRVTDFLPLTAYSNEREVNHTYQIWYQVLELLKMALGLGLAGRLLFDFYAWQERVGEDSAASSRHKGRRRRKRTHDGSVVEPVDHPDNSHVDG
jgi:hypothetical protein